MQQSEVPRNALNYQYDRHSARHDQAVHAIPRGRFVGLQRAGMPTLAATKMPQPPPPPMLASLEPAPLESARLAYEPKYDGIRALVDVRPPARRGGEPKVALYSRNGREKHAQFPGIVRALAAMAGKLDGPVLLDGEIVAVDARGVPLGFQHLQGRIHLTSIGDIERAERAQPAALV